MKSLTSTEISSPSAPADESDPPYTVLDYFQLALGMLSGLAVLGGWALVCF